MRFSFAAVTGLLAAVPAFVVAQDPSQVQGGGQGQGQMVMVGQDGGLTFTPSSMTATVGSNITFMFLSKNHSIAQSSFADPCNPVANGFAAQFFPIPQGETNFPTVTISVTTQSPIWFYCPQTNPANHCQAGMVGAINPTPDKTFEQFQAIAKGQQPPPAASSGSSAAAPGASAPTTGGTTSGTTSGAGAPVSNGAPVTAAIPSATPAAGGSTTSSAGGAAQTTQPSAASPQMKGAFTAIVIGVLGIGASLL